MMLKFLKKFKFNRIDVVIYKITRETIILFPDLGFEIHNEVISSAKKKYFIIDNGVSVHNSFLFTTVFLLKLIRKEGPVIGDCFTHNDYRGKSIYPYVINFIAKKMFKESKIVEVFIIVNQDNLSSIKGIEKSGFKKTASIKALKWLCFYFDKNIINY